MDDNLKGKLLKALAANKKNIKDIRNAVEGNTDVSKALREVEFNLLDAEDKLRRVWGYRLSWLKFTEVKNKE